MNKNLQPVIFARISEVDQNLVNNEPQFIRVRQNNIGFISLDTAADKLFQSATGVQLASHNFVTGIRKIGIKKIVPSSFDIEWFAPNVNIRNNNIKFLSSNTGATVHSVIVPEGWYLDSTLMMNAVVVALNTVTVASGLTFAQVINPLNTRVSTLTTIGGTYFFDLNCSAIIRGKPLWNLPTEQVLSASKTVGYIGLQYTRYIDIESRVLTQYTKNDNVNNTVNTGADLLLRVFLNIGGPQKLQFFSFEDLAWITWNPSETINNIDIRIFDQFGEFIYIPQLAEGTNSGFQYRINILTST